MYGAFTVAVSVILGTASLVNVALTTIGGRVVPDHTGYGPTYVATIRVGLTFELTLKTQLLPVAVKFFSPAGIISETVMELDLKIGPEFGKTEACSI